MEWAVNYIPTPVTEIDWASNDLFPTYMEGNVYISCFGFGRIRNQKVGNQIKLDFLNQFQLLYRTLTDQNHKLAYYFRIFRFTKAL